MITIKPTYILWIISVSLHPRYLCILPHLPTLHVGYFKNRAIPKWKYLHIQSCYGDCPRSCLDFLLPRFLLPPDANLLALHFQLQSSLWPCPTSPAQCWLASFIPWLSKPWATSGQTLRYTPSIWAVAKPAKPPFTSHMSSSVLDEIEDQ